MKHTGRGLIIKKPWTDHILSGLKTWEIRGSRTNIRGKIDIIQSGSGLVVGSVDLVDCLGPFQFEDFYNLTNWRKHCILPTENMPYPKTYAWVLENPKEFKKPVPYKHPSGAVIWVKL